MAHLAPIEKTLLSLIRTYQSLNASSIPVLTSTPSATEFGKYVAANRPFVVRAQGQRDRVAALGKWSDEYLMERMGERKVDVAVSPDGRADSVIDGAFVEPATVQMTIRELFAQLALPEEEKGPVYYLQSQNGNILADGELAALREDVGEGPSWAREVFGEPPEVANVWMGDSRSVTSMHKDPYENIYMVVRGSKTFTLIPPAEFYCLHEAVFPAHHYVFTPPSTFALSPPTSASTPWIPFDPLHPSAQFPRFRHSRPLTATLHPGDMLYLPSLWFHRVAQDVGPGPVDGDRRLAVAVNWWFDMRMDGEHWKSRLCLSTLFNSPHFHYKLNSESEMSSIEDNKHLWLRCETKEFEHRAALTPTTAKKLMDAGFKISVERDPQRIFADEEYEKVGCQLVSHNSWPSAPLTTPIIGLKELPENDTSPLPHTHIMFAHCYKQQGGWIDVLQRWQDGQPTGMLYDLEFLQDERGRRVAAFGYHAGFAGSAVGALALVEQLREKDGKGRLGEIKPYPNEKELVDYVKGQLPAVEKALGRPPKALVIGALGRCGSGALDFLLKAGFKTEDVAKWDMAETAKGGPFEEILEADIFVNCIYLSAKIPSFVSPASIDAAGEKRNLRVVVDVSCDTTNPNNPIPIYTVNTTFDKPTVDVPGVKAGPPLTVCSIDHLPTLLPREASEAFSHDLLPSLLTLPEALVDKASRQGQTIKASEAGKGPERVWREAEALFWTKLGESQLAK